MTFRPYLHNSGFTLDNSGWSIVWICPECGWQGAAWNTQDASHGIAEHLDLHPDYVRHRGKQKCLDCDLTAVRRGMCGKHYRAEMSALRGADGRAPGNLVHGLRSTYVGHMCRCRECVLSNSQPKAAA